MILNAQTDSLTYNINQSLNKQVNKRSILSWDESLPNHLHSRWLQFYNELKLVNGLEISRQVVSLGSERIEIHDFADASSRTFKIQLIVYLVWS